jgi:hypothetical protein
MKRKICVTLLALSSGLMMVFAVTNADKCTEKFESCKESCASGQAMCKARGSIPEACNFRYKQCIADCDKDLKTCQAKSQVKPSPTPPAKKPGKK